MDSPPQWTNITHVTCYTKGIESDTGENTVAANKKLDNLADVEPIAVRDSHPWGWIELYAPNEDPSDWADHAWVLVTDRGGQDDKPIYARLKAEYAYAIFERPWMLANFHKFPKQVDKST